MISTLDLNTTRNMLLVLVYTSRYLMMLYIVYTDNNINSCSERTKSPIEWWPVGGLHTSLVSS